MRLKSLAIIGYGTMGQAFLQGLLQHHVLLPEQIIVAGPDEQKLARVHQQWGVTVTMDNAQAVATAQRVLLAVKPQQLRQVLTELQSVLSPQTLLISVAAGFSIPSITAAVGNAQQPVVRVMPNLAATVGMSASGWLANQAVTAEHKTWVKRILQAVGTEFSVASEEMLDVVTAVIGSGPAYYYYFTEAIHAAAVQEGMGSAQAAQLVQQTFLGAATLLQQSGKTSEELRKAVTSKGGTTEAALREMELGQLRKTVGHAIRAARRRATQLKQ